MMYRIRIHPKLTDDFKCLPSVYQTRILGAIHSLADNPRPIGVKKLADIKSSIKNAYRIRVGNYRIGYQVFDNEVLVSVIAVAERGKIYPLLKRRLKK